MEEGTYLCKKLELTIHLEPNKQHGGELLRFTLSNPMSMNDAEICYQVTPDEDLKQRGWRDQRQYHLGEAVVLAMRRLMGEAVRLELIKLPLRPPGVSTTSSVSLKSSVPDSASKSSIPEEF
jgi:hypothetical protein